MRAREKALSMNTKATTLLEAREVSRSFDEFQALAPTNLGLASGELVAITGPNGAGKSTLLLCLSGLLRPTTGNVLVEGYDLYGEERRAKQGLAFVPDVPRFYPELTAWEHLQFMALAYDANGDFAQRAEVLLKEFGLWEARQLFPHVLSRGMRLKLGLLIALIRPFRVLLLDEPGSALDTESTAILREELARLRAQGAAILLSTHSTELTAGLADRTWTMHHGVLTFS
jgi:ABC-2 type transport system ATP-binding protein